MFQPSKVHWVLAVVSGIFLGAGVVAVSQQQPVQALAPPPARTPMDLSTSFREVAQRVLPAVVSISTETGPREVASIPDDGQEGEIPESLSPLEKKFLEEFMGQDPRFNELFRNQRNSPRSTPRQRGAGSGFIVDEKGIILTNSHVVEGADQVTVRLYDGREFQAESWDYDPRSDVAIVRIKADEPLPFAALGDSEQMQVGDWVLALGNPFNVGTTVTSGIISARERGPGINEREEYLQTDAAINPGNSGGPLVNLNGDVIGINTAISSRSGGYDGIGFAIPSSMVRWVADQLIADGEVKRSYLGVQLQILSNDLRTQLNVDLNQGALVSEVMADTPAKKGGIEAGDVILKFGGTEIKNRDDLVDLVERSVPDKIYPVEVLRNGSKETLNVKLERMPSDYTAALRRGRRPDARNESTPSQEVEMEKLGIQASAISAELAKQLGLASDVKGVVVRSVKAGSPAERGGLNAGDVIQRVGTTTVNTLDEFREAIKDVDTNTGLLLHIKRGAGAAFVVIKPGT